MRNDLSKYTVRVHVLVDGEARPVLERKGDTLTQIMPEEEWAPLRRRIAERACREMGDYYARKG